LRGGSPISTSRKGGRGTRGEGVQKKLQGEKSCMKDNERTRAGNKDQYG